MQYPGHVVTIGAPADEALAVQTQLASRGYLPHGEISGFDGELASLVKLFQSQNVDLLNRPLRVDGKVGPLTWSALFRAASDIAEAAGPAAAALAVAHTQLGVREVPPGSNDGPAVKAFLAAAGVGSGNAWCMAFVYWCFWQAGGDATLFPRTAGCLDAWRKVSTHAPHRIVSKAAAIRDPGLLRKGLVFVLDHGGGHGHTGFVVDSVAGALKTIEGNSMSDAAFRRGESEGVGVFELSRRSVMDDELLGFLDFNAV